MTRQEIVQKLTAMGLSLPEVAKAVGSYVPAVRSGSLIFVSGQLPSREGKILFSGKLGADVSLADGQQAARLCALNALAAAAGAAGGIEQIVRIVRLAVFVSSTPEFTDQPKVANGASDLMQALFGEAGRHVRLAVGAPSLPLNAAVEVELWAESL